MRGTAYLLLVCVLSQAFSAIYALYEDEAGSRDWHHKWIGKVQEASFDHVFSRSVVVSTERNVVASLSLADGGVVWRHVAKEDHKVAMASSGNTVAIVDASSNALTVRNVAITNGRLHWEASFPRTVSMLDVPPAATMDTTQTLYVVDSTGVLRKLDATGETVWESKVAIESKGDLRVIISGNKLYVVEYLRSGSKIHLVQFLINIETGKLMNTYKADSTIDLESDVVFTADYIVWINNNHLTWLASGTKAINHLDNKEILPVRQVLAAKGNDLLLLYGGNANGDEVEAVFMKAAEKDGWLKAEQSLNAPRVATSMNGGIVKFFESDRRDNLFVTRDGSIQYVAEDGSVWSREESLAHTADALLVDLPEKHLLAKDQIEKPVPHEDSVTLGALEHYIRRWSAHLHAARDLPSWFVSRFEGILDKIPIAKQTGERDVNLRNAQNAIDIPTEIDAQSLLRDTFGLRKFAVHATTTGKLIALDTGKKGKGVWASMHPGVSFQKIFILRSATVKYPPILAAIGTVTSAPGQVETCVVAVNGLTGAPVASLGLPNERLPYEVERVFRLPLEDQTEKFYLLALVDRNKAVHVYPGAIGDTESVKQALEQSQWTIALKGQIGDNSISGYRVTTPEKGNNYRTEQVWQVSFGAGESIVAVGSQNGEDKVASLGRVLGNRNVLYKYLNPNMIGLATLNRQSKTLTISIIDLMTGSILHQITHQDVGTEQPVHLTQSENWVVYHYWSDAAKDAKQGKGYVTVVVDFYESSNENERIAKSNFSSFDNVKPYGSSTAFYSPYGVQAIGHTRTRNGITTKEIIFATMDHHLIGINKKLLDPRRPKGKITAEDKEEMLIPYNPVLPDDKRLSLAYDLDVQGIESIKTSPALLESTSLVLAYGLDTFFTYSAPSKQFDVLSEEFNKAQLLLTMVALSVGIVICRPMVQRKRVNARWT